MAHQLKLLGLCMAMSFMATPAQAVTISNGDFETTGPGIQSWDIGPGTEIGDANGVEYATCCNVGALGDPNNRFAAFGGGSAVNVSTLSQSFATIATQLYIVSFRLTGVGALSQALNGSVFNGTAVSGTGALGALTQVATAGQPFATYTFNFTAMSALSTLSFAVSPTGTGGGDGVDVLLDDVSVSAAPEPATWAMMILGFGVVGAALRRRRPANVSFA